MVELIETENGLIGVSARNVWYVNIYGLTREEYDETCDVIRTLFAGRGYKYIAEANKIFKELIDKQKNEALILENQKLKSELKEKEASSVPKTIGSKVV